MTIYFFKYDIIQHHTFHQFLPVKSGNITNLYQLEFTKLTEVLVTQNLTCNNITGKLPRNLNSAVAFNH